MREGLLYSEIACTTGVWRFYGVRNVFFLPLNKHFFMAVVRLTEIKNY